MAEEEKETTVKSHDTVTIKKPKLIIFSLLVFFIIISFLFYWYQAIPSLLRSECNNVAVKRATELLKTKSEINPGSYVYKEGVKRDLYSRDDYEDLYKQCLHEKGLK